MPVAVDVMKLLGRPANLRVALVDDYRPAVTASGKNWQQLDTANFPIETILQENVSLESCGKRYEDNLNSALAWADFTIGQFGLGAGFHTGGIQPNSSAAHEMQKLAVSYARDEIEHLTITPALISKLDVVFINSTGEAKRPLVEHFLSSQASIYEEPTQALKTAAKTILCSDVLPKP